MALLEPPQQLFKLLNDALPPGTAPQTENDVSGTTEILAYVAFLATGLAEHENFDPAVWKEALEPYLEEVTKDQTANVIEEYCVSAMREITEEDDAESYGDGDDDEAEELCNLRFNLAYGGKILLQQTRLRLLRGHRYALVGKNGVGKTTLMNAIAKGKIDGWPSNLVTAYVDSGSNVDPAYEANVVLPYLMESTKRNKDDCVALLQELDFTDAMLEGTIGALSGGWQMKLRLVRAILMKPDIYLLDEPTVREVEWHGPP